MKWNQPWPLKSGPKPLLSKVHMTLKGAGHLKHYATGLFSFCLLLRQIFSTVSIEWLKLDHKVPDVQKSVVAESVGELYQTPRPAPLAANPINPFSSGCSTLLLAAWLSQNTKTHHSSCSRFPTYPTSCEKWRSVFNCGFLVGEIAAAVSIQHDLWKKKKFRFSMHISWAGQLLYESVQTL